MRVVAGRYAIRDELGRGGMGVVWRADDQVIGRQVALKEIPPPQGVTGDDRAVYLERVLREARTAGRLNDPAVVTVYDVVSENGATFIVMELVEAPTLADIIAAEGPLPAERVSSIGLQVLGALETAHAAGIVHRDVKPSNIMVMQGDRVKLADFGIARAMDDPNLTMTGGIMGSPGYMSPELFSGSQPSPATDLWALGATLFHAVEGRSPFNRETTAATMHAIMYDDPQLTRCQGPLAQVILGLLTQSPEARLTVARTRELLSSPVSDRTQVVEQHTQVVDAPTVQVHAVRRDTRPREPWQEAYPEEAPLAAPAPVSWGEDQWGTPSAEKKNGNRKRVLLLSGAAVVVVGALLAVFLILPSGQEGEAAGKPVTNVGETESQSVIATPVLPSSVPPSSTVSSAPPPSTVTVTKSDTPIKQPKPTGGQQPVGTPPPPPPDKPQRNLVQITRYNHPKGPHFTATPNVPAPAGFNREFPMGWLVADAETGTKRLYACQLKGSEDRMTSVDPGCEGHTQVGVLGYIFTSKPAGVNSRGLFRCTYSGGHYDSTDAKCEGYNPEFQFGYILV
ncbi:serine/threonine-protein kinase [Kibdelosporangium aridum]|uniref:non-specific serine/threonine protein kinase n=3 Tax=Kibdelosporangium aridum TaxID=2030 RepID=A0A1Y5XUN4_KIBAR|nr:serine/threonine-protein kinase [Kibdelosporangium aridum]SMD18391.1 Serine/threonine protein kinase [Kibdelosporangium aridum]